jgi:alkylation response protein AidB-like acyl-CoA dehydrogenase
MDAAAKMDPVVTRALFDAGFMSIEAEEKYGGVGASFVSACLVIEELAKVCPATSVHCDVQNTLVATILNKHASEALKEEWLPRLATDVVGSFALSETEAGSDAFALKTRAVADGDDFLLTGTKAWITNADEAGLFLVFANVNPDAGYKGITCFAVPRDAPGFSVGPKENKLGIRASSTCPLVLDNVRVPASSIVGKKGEGYKIAIGTLNEGRIGIAAQALGIAQGTFDATIPYLLERRQFGKAVGDQQALQVEYADAATEIEAARTLTYNAARLREAGKPFLKEAAMAKLFASQVAVRTSAKCVEWCGGVGFIEDFPQPSFLRSSLITTIYEGTSIQQRLTIAKQLKGEYGQ